MTTWHASPGRVASYEHLLVLAAAVFLPLLCSGLIVAGYPVVGVGLALFVASSALVMLSDVALVTSFIFWATFSAGIRRLIDYTFADAGIAVYLPLAVMSILVLIRAAARWQHRSVDRFDMVALAVAGVTVLGMVSSGDPLSGLSAGPIALLPLCWYVAGRVLLSPEQVRGVFRFVAGLAIVVAVIGLAQSFGHFTPFDRAWVEGSDFSSLNLGGATRAFGTMSSPAEYSRYLAIAIVVLVVMPSRYVASIGYRIVGIAVLGTALWYSGVRSAVILLALAVLVVVLLARTVTPAVRFTVAAACLVAALVLFSSEPSAESSNDTASAATAATQRQIEGLQQPFDDDASTVSEHWTITSAAIRGLPGDPLGHGTVTITPAAKELGTTRPGADGDIARSAVAWGVPGFLVFLALIYFVTRTLWRANRRRDLALGPLALGVAVVLFLQWLNASFYVAPELFWLVMGGVVGELHAPPRDAAIVDASSLSSV